MSSIVETYLFVGDSTLKVNVGDSNLKGFATEKSLLEKK
jgi:hypothetical protein